MAGPTLPPIPGSAKSSKQPPPDPKSQSTQAPAPPEPSSDPATEPTTTAGGGNSNPSPIATEQASQPVQTSSSSPAQDGDPWSTAISIASISATSPLPSFTSNHAWSPSSTTSAQGTTLGVHASVSVGAFTSVPVTQVSGLPSPSASTSSSPPPSTSGRKDRHSASILGAVLGITAFILLLVIAFLVYLYNRRRRKNRETDVWADDHYDPRNGTRRSRSLPPVQITAPYNSFASSQDTTTLPAAAVTHPKRRGTWDEQYQPLVEKRAESPSTTHHSPPVGPSLPSSAYWPGSSASQPSHADARRQLEREREDVVDEMEISEKLERLRRWLEQCKARSKKAEEESEPSSPRFAHSIVTAEDWLAAGAP